MHSATSATTSLAHSPRCDSWAISQNWRHFLHLALQRAPLLRHWLRHMTVSGFDEHRFETFQRNGKRTRSNIHWTCWLANPTYTWMQVSAFSWDNIRCQCYFHLWTILPLSITVEGRVSILQYSLFHRQRQLWWEQKEYLHSFSICFHGGWSMSTDFYGNYIPPKAPWVLVIITD